MPPSSAPMTATNQLPARDGRRGLDTLPNLLTASRDAALQGAASAFSGRPPVKPKPELPLAAQKDGALAAARTSARNQEAERLHLQRTGESSSTVDSSHEPRIPPRRLSQRGLTNGRDHLNLSSSNLTVNSPSFIAATLAASRSAAVTPNHTGHSIESAAHKQLGSSRSSRSISRSPGRPDGRPENGPDTTPIPPTTSLIGMFEKAGAAETPPTKRPVKKPAASRRISAGTTPTKPVVTPSPESAAPPLVQSPTAVSPIEKNRPRLPPPTKPRDIPRKKPTRPLPTVVRRLNESSSDDSFVSASEDADDIDLTIVQKTKPTPPPPRRRTTERSVGTAYEIDSLADAIVASSLATSRASSPPKSSSNNSPVNHAPRRSLTHGHLSRFTSPFHSHDSRNTSPVRGGMRQTMRKPPKEEEDEMQKARARKHLRKKHAHHEGDRKRWRDSVTERERRRYEAVWASNRGVLLGADDADRVLDLVVRDVWLRCRLPGDVLEEIWDLVDRSRVGALDKEEFVVGLWLIDQRLKGRKLPTKVSQSVWESVGKFRGLKVRDVR